MYSGLPLSQSSMQILFCHLIEAQRSARSFSYFKINVIELRRQTVWDQTFPQNLAEQTDVCFDDVNDKPQAKHKTHSFYLYIQKPAVTEVVHRDVIFLKIILFKPFKCNNIIHLINSVMNNSALSD